MSDKDTNFFHRVKLDELSNDTKIKYTHHVIFEYHEDISIKTADININTNIKIEDVEYLKQIAEEIYIQTYGKLPEDWTYLDCTICDYKKYKNETIINGVKLKIVNSLEELKHYEKIQFDICRTYLIKDKNYCHAESESGERLAVFEDILDF